LGNGLEEKKMNFYERKLSFKKRDPTSCERKEKTRKAGVGAPFYRDGCHTPLGFLPCPHTMGIPRKKDIGNPTGESVTTPRRTVCPKE